MSEMKAFEIRNYLLSMLREGRFGADGRLPTERELSETTGVPRRTVRQALSALEAEGLIWRRQGKGTFAGQPREPLDALADEINDTSEPIEVMEARLCLEPELAALSATRATPDEVARMWTLARHVYELQDSEMTELWDSALHRLIAQSARNRPLQTAYGLLDNSRSEEGWKDVRERARSEQSLSETFDQHMAIVSAIESGDPEAAREAMRTHLLARITALSETLGVIRSRSNAEEIAARPVGTPV